MIFHEIQFPKVISSGARGGPRRADEMTILGSGYREVNSPWADSLREYDAGVALRNMDDLDLVLHFWEGRRGRVHPFRWWDAADFKSCAPLQATTALDQAIGLGDDATVIFPLTKTYEPAGPNPWVRRIWKPVDGTV